MVDVIRQHRFLTTRLVAGFCIPGAASPTAALRAANRALTKLSSYRLIRPLARRIGGVRAGSGSTVWVVTEAGQRLLRLCGQAPEGSRRRFHDPSPGFLQHHLAVAGVHLTICEQARNGAIVPTLIQLEPDCWRRHLGPGGNLVWLKPDMAAVIRVGDYEDHYFFEIDRATENPARVLHACRRYQRYWQTGLEQQRHGLFPAVVWIVPNETRRWQLQRHIAATADLDQRLLRVIIPSELAQLLRRGPGQPTLPDDQ